MSCTIGCSIWASPEPVGILVYDFGVPLRLCLITVAGIKTKGTLSGADQSKPQHLDVLIVV
ncbi:hypothetical protein [Synechococcus sp. M16CYN]|uniref:hypothetical protein n=1 Tax=Synechococcus sp. M16CYN TaxID=3103139 RepID=UPI0033417D80